MFCFKNVLLKILACFTGLKISHHTTMREKRHKVTTFFLSDKIFYQKKESNLYNLLYTNQEVQELRPSYW